MVNTVENVEQLERSSTAGESVTWSSHFGQQLAVSPKVKYSPWCLPKRNENMCRHNNSYANGYSSFIHNY